MGDAGAHRGGWSAGLSGIAWVTTVDAQVRARADDPAPGLVAEGRTWSWAEHTAEAAARAAWYAQDRAARGATGPAHIGVLLENVPAYSFWLAAAALGRFVLVGLNSTRRGDDLAADVRATACDLVLTEDVGVFEGLDLGAARVITDGDYAPAALPAGEAATDDLYLLIFTSGTTGTPKAVRCSQGKIATYALGMVMRTELSAADVAYVSMPLFHSNAVIAGWAPSQAVGATVALRRRFSASRFLPDVRRVGATYANYVGTPLSYVLAQPEQPNDADNPLRLVFGNEGAPADLARFSSRFGCQVMDGFGSTEGGISITKTPDTPAGALGVGVGEIRVLRPETGEECPAAQLDEAGRLVNPDEAVGELVNMDGLGGFEGYWDADEDTATRARDGRYWSGDLGYRTADGFLWFAGRSLDRLRVGGENFSSAPVARVLGRHPQVVEVVVYAVPDPVAGDQVMAAVVPGEDFDPAGFAQWAADQPDCASAWVPRFVRVVADPPRTATGKILVRALAAARWDGTGVWTRDGRDLGMRPFTVDDAAAWEAAFTDSGRVLH